MLKLSSITLPDDKPRELRLERSVDCDKPTDGMIGWQVRVNGPAVILISPAKDKSGKPVRTRKMYEFARSACVLVWSTDDIDDADKVQKHNTPPLSRETPPEPVVDADVEVRPAAQQGARK